MKFQEEINKRRTFGIISHPDAGKTTLTEKLLLFGGAIQTAGADKNNKIKKTATSDFMEIEKQYTKYCPNNRVNFLNYYYVLFKLCELLQEKHFLPYFPMLKDQTKRIEQDVIWKKICKELKWTFYPTI